MADDLVFEKLETVKDAKTFIAFLNALMEDLPSREEVDKHDAAQLYFNGLDGWMNLDLWSFLEAATAGGSANLDAYDDVETSVENAWNTAARIILQGKYYE